MYALWILKRPLGSSVMARPHCQIESMNQLMDVVPETMVLRAEYINTNRPIGTSDSMEYYAYTAPMLPQLIKGISY
ncbi:MAG: hypothetical protein ABIO88_10580 [Burkholderiaceae bacterium]